MTGPGEAWRTDERGELGALESRRATTRLARRRKSRGRACRRPVIRRTCRSRGRAALRQRLGPRQQGYEPDFVSPVAQRAQDLLEVVSPHECLGCDDESVMTPAWRPGPRHDAEPPRRRGLKVIAPSRRQQAVQAEADELRVGNPGTRQSVPELGRHRNFLAAEGPVDPPQQPDDATKPAAGGTAQGVKMYTESGQAGLRSSTRGVGVLGGTRRPVALLASPRANADGRVGPSSRNRERMFYQPDPDDRAVHDFGFERNGHAACDDKPISDRSPTALVFVSFQGTPGRELGRGHHAGGCVLHAGERAAPSWASADPQRARSPSRTEQQWGTLRSAGTAHRR